MRHVLAATCAAFVLTLAGTTSVRAEEEPADVKELQSEVEALKAKIRAAEARLQKAKAAGEAGVKKPGEAGVKNPANLGNCMDMVRMISTLGVGLKAEWDARGAMKLDSRHGPANLEWHTKGWVKFSLAK